MQPLAKLKNFCTYPWGSEPKKMRGRERGAPCRIVLLSAGQTESQ